MLVHSGYTFFISMCVLWELNPQPFALLMQCSTTEPQEHYLIIIIIIGSRWDVAAYAETVLKGKTFLGLKKIKFLRTNSGFT